MRRNEMRAATRHLLLAFAVPVAFAGTAAGADDDWLLCGPGFRLPERPALEAAGPIDLCLLGLGLNGHLALNEPAESFDPFCHVATLAERSRTHPMLAETADPVRHGLTLGLGDILRARRILLMVSGAAKREPLARLAARRVTPVLPASFLWLHGDAVCLCDEDAAADTEFHEAEP